VSVTQQMIPVRAAIRYGVMALQSPLVVRTDNRQPRRHFLSAVDRHSQCREDGSNASKLLKLGKLDPWYSGAAPE
jgi:hypothetical protein